MDPQIRRKEADGGNKNSDEDIEHRSIVRLESIV
jgi:hypothetical protein